MIEQRKQLYEKPMITAAFSVETVDGEQLDPKTILQLARAIRRHDADQSPNLSQVSASSLRRVA